MSMTVRREYWQLRYRGETGPDSWQGGWDTPEAARDALVFERAQYSQPGRLLDPARLTAERVQVIERITREPW